MKLSAIIIAKNAEDLIVDCIESVEFADEIIVVDNSSADRTADIAKRMGAKVIKEETGSFAAQRNRGLKEAKGEWVLYVDTDERVTSELKDEIQSVILGNEVTPESAVLQVGRGKDSGQARMTTKGGFVAYRVTRQNFYLGHHPWPKQEHLERLFKKSHLKEWYGKLHESPRVEGKVGDVEGLLLHYTHRDLTSMLSKTIQWSQVEAQLRMDAHHPQMTWWRFFRVMVTGFYDSYVKQKGYKAGTVGLIESMYQAFSMFITYARLWELQQKNDIQK